MESCFPCYPKSTAYGRISINCRISANPESSSYVGVSINYRISVNSQIFHNFCVIHSYASCFNGITGNGCSGNSSFPNRSIVSTVFKSCSRGLIAYRVGSTICPLYNIYNAQSLLTSAGESSAGSIGHLSNIFVYRLLICQRLGCVSRSIYSFKRNVITIGQLTYGCGICTITYHRHSLPCSSCRNIAFISSGNTFCNLVAGHGSGYIFPYLIHNRISRLIADVLPFGGHIPGDHILQVSIYGFLHITGDVIHQLATYRIGHVGSGLTGNVGPFGGHIPGYHILEVPTYGALHITGDVIHQLATYCVGHIGSRSTGNVGPFGGHIPGYHVLQVPTYGVLHITGYVVHQLATYCVGHISSSVIHQRHSLIGNTAIGCRICNICRALINRCSGCTISHPLNNLCHSLGNIRLQIS